MRDKITGIVKTHFGDIERIIFGYDCIGIVLPKIREPMVNDIVELQKDLQTDLGWVKTNKEGNLLICYDITNFILDEFGSWEAYEQKYDL